MKDKVGSIAPPAFEPTAAGSSPAGGDTADAVAALVNLGFPRTDAFGAVARAGQKLGDGAAVDALIRAGLQALSK